MGSDLRWFQCPECEHIETARPRHADLPCWCHDCGRDMQAIPDPILAAERRGLERAAQRAFDTGFPGVAFDIRALMEDEG